MDFQDTVVHLFFLQKEVFKRESVSIVNITKNMVQTKYKIVPNHSPRECLQVNKGSRSIIKSLIQEFLFGENNCFHFYN